MIAEQMIAEQMIAEQMIAEQPSKRTVSAVRRLFSRCCSAPAAALVLAVLTVGTLFFAGGCGNKPAAPDKKDAPPLEVDLGNSSDSPAIESSSTGKPVTETPTDPALESDSEKDK